MRRFPFLLVALIGCGEVKDPKALPDAPPGDTDDATPSGRVKITVLSPRGDGAPEVTAKVILQDTSGAFVYDGPVDANGVVEHDFEGGTVTAVVVASENVKTMVRGYAILSVRGVKPGDDIVLGRKAAVTQLTGAETTMNAFFAPVTGATQHTFYTPCAAFNAGVTSPAPLVFRESCTAATFPAIAVTNTTPPQYALGTFTYTAGGEFAIGGFATMQTFSANVQNVPAEVSALSVTRSSMMANRTVASQQANLGDPTQANVTASIPYIPGFGPRSQVVATYSRPDARNTQRAEIHTANLGNSIDIDLDRKQLAWITGLAATGSGATFTLVAPSEATADISLLQWAPMPFATTDGFTTTVGWQVAQEQIVTPFDVPELPPAYDMIDPRKQATPPTPFVVIVSQYDYSEIAGWDAARQQPYTLNAALDDIKEFEGKPVQRRVSTASFIRRGAQ